MNNKVNLSASRHQVLAYVDVVVDSASGISGKDAVRKLLDIEGVTIRSIGNLGVIIHTEEQFCHAINICNVMVDSIGDDEQHPLFPLMHALMNAIGDWEDEHVQL